MSKEKSQKYIDLISLSKEAVEKEQIQLDNEAALNQLNHDLHSAKTKVSNSKKAVLQHKRAQPFNVANLIQANRTLALAEKDVVEITAVRDELF
jgi:DNA topoisomerase IA